MSVLVFIGLHLLDGMWGCVSELVASLTVTTIITKRPIHRQRERDTENTPEKSKEIISMQRLI